MTDGKSSMSKRTKAAFAVVAVAIMIGAVFPLFFNDSSADPQLQAYQQSITYNSNNGQNYTRTIIYDGIASTEYNPEFWEGTGHVPSSITVYMRQVDPETGDLKKEGNTQLYDEIAAGTDIGNLAVYVNQGGNMVPYDPFIHGGTNNWKGEAVNKTDIVVNNVTIEPDTDVYLSEGLTITTVSPSTDVTFDGNRIIYSGTDPATVSITVTLSMNKVFAGWNTAADGTGNKYLPGDVILPGDTTFNAQWIIPDVFVKNTSTISNSSTTFYCEPYFTVTETKGTPDFSKSGYTVIRGDGRSNDTMYGTIYKLINNDDVWDQVTEDGRAIGDLYLDEQHKTSPTKDEVEKGEKTLYNYEGNTVSLTTEQKRKVLYVDRGNNTYKVANHEQINNDNTEFYTFNGSVFVKIGCFNFSGTHLSTGTYRSLDIDSKASLMINTGSAFLDGDVIIDDVHIDSSYTVKHNSNQGTIFANCHVLIMGVGLDNPGLTTSRDTSAGNPGAPCLYGGKSSSATTEYMTSENMQFFENKKRFVLSERDGQNNNVTCDHYVSTCVIVHSGIYKVIAGGSYKTGIGNDSNNRSTYIVLRGGTSGDTIYGGGTDTGGITGDTRDRTGNASDMRYGGTFAYLLGHFFMTGDNWEDKMTGDLYKIAGRDTFKVLENTIATASNQKADTKSASHLFISDNASVWVANAANREEVGYTRVGVLDISGSAVVRNIAAGGIANAKLQEPQGKDPTESIKETWLCIRDNATVALALGGGYDIWQNPNAIAMKQGSVNVIIEGGTIGNVYGGGYRGSIGTPDDLTALTVNVTVNGGTILGNVYGGGCGGLDRGQHNPDGTKGRDGSLMSEGKSCVYGNVTVNITGGSVNGNVYGGGMSAPIVCYYIVDASYKTATGQQKTDGQGVGSIYVKNGTDSYTSATKEDIYNGTQLYTYNGSSYTTKTFAKDSDKAKVLYVDDGYGNYYAATKAQLDARGDNLKILNGTRLKMNDPVNGNYVAAVYGKTTVNVLGGDIAGSVYGGGEGLIMTKTGSNNCEFVKDYTRITIVKNFTGQPVTIDTIPWYINGEYIYRTLNMYNTYLSYAKVDSDTSVNVTGNAHISGGVFGGGCSGYVNGNRTVNVACTSTAEGEDYNVDNSVYGGSSEGNDIGNATVVISAGKLKGSVFGGGFMGVTTGDTKVYLGYVLEDGSLFVQDSDHNITSEPSITISDSVFAGANVKDDPTMEPYTETLVDGTGYVYVNGTITSVNISGSIMGDGNSCLTGTGEGHNAYIYINDYDCGESELTGIHRAKEVVLESSIVKISGKEARVYKDGNNVVVKTASLFRIENLKLKDGTILSIDQPAEDVRNYYSLNANDDPTVMSSPLNRIIFTSGSSFYIRTETSPSATDYGTVRGYTIMSVTDQTTFGAYVLGQPSSGGFVIMKNGLYETANISDFHDDADHDIRCWFISGMEKKVITMELDYTGSDAYVSSGIDLTKLQAGSDIRFSGGDYVSSGMTINFADSGFDEDTFGLKIGSIAEDGSALIMNNSNHYLYYTQADANPRHMITGTISGSGTSFSAIGFPSATPEQKDAAMRIYYSEDGGETLTRATAVQVIAGINLYYSEDGVNGTPATTAQIDARSKMCYSEDGKYFSLASKEQLETGSDLYFKSDGIPGTFRLNLQFIGNPANETDYLGYILLNVYEIQTFMVDGTQFELMVNQIEIRVDMYTQGDLTEKNVTHDITIDTVDHEGYTDILVPSTHTGQTLKVTSVTAIDSGDGKKIDIQGIGNISGTNGWKDVGPKSSLINFSQPITVGTLSGGYVATMRISVEGANVPPSFTVTCTIYDSDGIVKDTITINITVIDHNDVVVTFIVDNETTTTVNKPYGSTLLSTDCPAVSSNFIGWYTTSTYNKEYNFSLPLTGNITLYARYNYVVTFDYMDGSESTMNVPQNEGGVKIPAPSMPTRTGYTFSGWYKDTGYTDDWDFNTDKVTEDTTLYAEWTAKQLTVKYYNNDAYTDHSVIVNFGEAFGNNAIVDWSITHFDHWTCNNKWIYSDTLIDSNITIDWTNSEIRLDAEKYQDSSKTLYIMMNNSVGKLYYSTDGESYTEATPLQIASRANLYYSENGTNFTAATPEQISAAMSKVYSLLYTKATAEQISAGVNLRWSTDGSYFTAEIPDVNDPTYNTDNIYYYNGNALEFKYILTSESRTGYNLDWWGLVNDDGSVNPNYKYKAGTQITIRMVVELSNDDVIVKKVYLGNDETPVFDYNDNTHKLDDPTNPYYISFKASWVLIDYSVVLSNTENTKGDNTPGQAQFTKNYYGCEGGDGTIHLEYIGTNVFSKWSIIGDYDPTGFVETDEVVDLKIRGDCTISAVEVSGQQVWIYVSYNYGDGNSGSINESARPDSIYISYDDTLQELDYNNGQHTTESDLYKGKIKSLKTNFEIYIEKNGVFYRVTEITYTSRGYNLTLEEIVVATSVPSITGKTLDGVPVTCKDLMNTIESTSLNPYICEYGDGEIGEIYFITGDKYGNISITGNSITVDGYDVSTVNGYAGDTSFTVNSTTQKDSDITHLQRTFYIHVKPRHVFLIGVTEWTQQGNDWESSGTTYTIFNDDGQAGTVLGVSSTARPSVQTPGVTVNVISYTPDSLYSVTVLNGMYIVVKSNASTVCVDLVFAEENDPLHASMAAPLSVDQISEKAKLESAGNIMAVISHSMGRRL